MTGVMCDSSEVGVMCDSSEVGVMCECVCYHTRWCLAPRPQTSGLNR